MHEIQLPSHWEILNTMDAQLNAKMTAWREHINRSPLLERKYKELIMVSMACVLRFTVGIEIHGQYALDFGATKGELLAAVEQSFFMGGIPALREGLLVFYTRFADEDEG